MRSNQLMQSNGILLQTLFLSLILILSSATDIHTVFSSPSLYEMRDAHRHSEFARLTLFELFLLMNSLLLPNIFCVIEAVEIQMIRCVMPNGFGLCNWNNSRTTPSTTNGWKSSYAKTKAKGGRFIRMIFAIVDLFLCLLDEYCAYSAWQCCFRLCCTKSLAKLQCSSILREKKLSAISSEHIIQYCLYSSVVCCACMW